MSDLLALFCGHGVASRRSFAVPGAILIVVQLRAPRERKITGLTRGLLSVTSEVRTKKSRAQDGCVLQKRFNSGLTLPSRCDKFPQFSGLPFLEWERSLHASREGVAVPDQRQSGSEDDGNEASLASKVRGSCRAAMRLSMRAGNIRAASVRNGFSRTFDDPEVPILL